MARKRTASRTRGPHAPARCDGVTDTALPDEVKQLKACITDLISVMSLPAIWSGSNPSQIGSTLLDALVAMLRLDFAYLRLNDPICARAPLAMLQIGKSQGSTAQCEAVGPVLEAWLNSESRSPHLVVPNPVGEGEISIAGAYLGLEAEIGALLVGSVRVDFPRETERLVLDVAANQAVIGLHEARRSVDQKRVAEELDRRVAQGTRELVEREARIRRLMDANIVGIFIWDFEGRILEANDAFLCIVGYKREDLASGRLRWTDLTPQEWLDRDQRQWVPELKRTGSLQPFEKEYFRKDGSRVPVLIGAATFEENNNQGVAFVLDLTERKRAEAAARAAKARLEGIVEIAQDAIISIDSQQRIVLFNQGAEKVFGYTQAEVIGRSLGILLPGHFKDVHWKHIEDFARSPEVTRTMGQRREVSGRRKDGSEFPAEASISKLKLGSELVSTVILRDITSRKRAEEALRRSEKELRDVIETIPAVAWSALPDGSNAFVNSRWTEYTGLSAEQTAGSGWQAAIHPEDVQRHVDKWRACVASGEPLAIEVRFRRGDGQYHWHLVHGLPLRDEHGEILKWYGIVTDIEDRKRAEQELKRNEAWLADAQALTHTGSFVWDCRTREALYLSDEWYRIFEFDRNRGKRVWEERWQRIHPEDRPRWQAAVERAIKDKCVYELEERLILPGGAIKYLHVIGHPVETPSGDVMQFMGSVTDITERKRAEEERERLRQLEADLAHMNRVSTMGELAASLSHELKQPITAAIIGAKTCLRWLKRDQPDIEQAREAATRIVQDSNRAAEVIDRLRSLYKKGVALERELVDVNEVLGEMLALLRSEAARYSIFMHTDLATDLPKVRADRVQLQQVLLNLILNGIQAMKDTAGELTIKSEVGKDDQVLISVSDTGVGLPAGKADQIFNAFFTTKPQGSGMGLAISRSIVESHGGRLWALANSGRGATFHFTLPTAA